jgi:hypothetical protein
LPAWVLPSGFGEAGFIIKPSFSNGGLFSGSGAAHSGLKLRNYYEESLT